MAEFERSSEESAPKPEEAEGLIPQPQEEKAVKLSQPSRELARRLLGRVRFEDRLYGVSSHPAEGDVREVIYSFAEAAHFLGGGEETLSEGIRRNPADGERVFSIDFRLLKKWVGETLGDKELAMAIGEVTKEGDQAMRPYQRYLKRIELIRPVKELMLKRLKQCMEILREETEA